MLRIRQQLSNWSRNKVHPRPFLPLLCAPHLPFGCIVPLDASCCARTPVSITTVIRGLILRLIATAPTGIMQVCTGWQINQQAWNRVLGRTFPPWDGRGCVCPRTDQRGSSLCYGGLFSKGATFTQSSCGYSWSFKTLPTEQVTFGASPLKKITWHVWASEHGKGNCRTIIFMLPFTSIPSSFISTI